MRRFAADNPAHRRIVAQALGVVYVLVAGETTKHRLPQQTDQCMAAVPTGARIGKSFNRHLVFTTWGALCWMPDMRIWAKVIASVLAPGGELYCADAHPSFSILEETAGRLVPTYDFETPADRPLEFDNASTYTGDPTVMTHRSTREWIHPQSAIISALLDAGLTIMRLPSTSFHRGQ
jgi:hypothetical protein